MFPLNALFLFPSIRKISLCRTRQFQNANPILECKINVDYQVTWAPLSPGCRCPCRCGWRSTCGRGSGAGWSGRAGSRSTRWRRSGTPRRRRRSSRRCPRPTSSWWPTSSWTAPRRTSRRRTRCGWCCETSGTSARPSCGGPWTASSRARTSTPS